MLTFLRKIRKSLVDSGSTRKYLLYAVGEIALVVIGILIALQINNLNEDRKLRIEENKLLGSIQEEFRYNYNELDRSIFTAKMVQDKCLQLLTNMGSKGALLKRKEADSLIYSGLYRIVTCDISNGILEDMLHSGRLHIISKDSLREKLANWGSALEDVKEDERWAVEFRNVQSLPFLRRHYSTNRLDIPSGFNFDHKEVFQMREFENLVDQHRRFNAMNEYNYNKLKNYVEEILSLCSVELREREDFSEE